MPFAGPKVKKTQIGGEGVSMSDAKTDVLAEAQRIVTGARRQAYGTPEDNFRRISNLWNAHMVNTGREAVFQPRDVATLMTLMKLARLVETPNHRDSIVDAIGYLACYAEMVLPAADE